MGLAYSAVPFTTLAWGEQHITSALASVMNAGTPLFAAVAAAVGLHERLLFPQVVGLVLGFVGVAVAAGVGGSDLRSSSLAGAGGALSAAACYGFGFAYAQRYVVGIPPLVAVFGQLVTGAVLIAPLAVVAMVGEGVQLGGRVVLSVVLLGVFGTGVAYVLNYQSIAAVGPTRASLVTYLVPVVAIAVGVLFLDEPFRLRLLVGAALVVLGIALLQERLRRFRRVPVAAAAVLLLLVACSADEASPACSDVVREPLDPGSTHHLLPGAPEPTYATDPPTSGAHRAGPTATGVVDEPLPHSVQSAVLEAGGVVVQYREPDDRRALAPLGGERVVVAPDADLPVRVVATAWRQKLACSGLDVDAVRALIEAPRSSPGH